MGDVLVGEQDHPWRVAAVVDPVGEQSRRALVQWSAVSVKMLAGPYVDHTEHEVFLKDREVNSCSAGGKEASKVLAVSTGGVDYDYMC